MLYIKLFIEREKNTGQSAPECPFKLCMCTDYGPDRLRFAGLIPERVQKVNTI